jgi:hypothetical protein
MSFSPDRGRPWVENRRVIEISGGKWHRVVMEASPTSSFIVAETEFLFQVLVVTLDAPAQFRDVDQRASAHARGQSGQPVFCGPRLSFRPFDQTPFLWSWGCPVIIAMRRADTYGGKRRSKVCDASLTLGYASPGAGGQTDRQFFR